MEDISRELEREIARARPKPHKQDRKTSVLIVDDFGKMKSGEYLKKLVLGLGAISFFCMIAAAAFFMLYNRVSGQAEQMRTRLERAEKKVAALTREKEVLMARLVITGKEAGILKTEPAAQLAENEIQNEKNDSANQKTQIKPSEIIAEKPKSRVVAVPEVQLETDVQSKLTDLPANELDNQPELTAGPKNVAIEKFTVQKDGVNGNLLVRFDIRNISTEPGDVSGRIFTVLKPENLDPDNWLVVPTSTLEGGKPAEYKKGQYFSIAHFKPVKFRIKNHTNPDFFKKASIYIFNNQGELIVEKLIDITEAEEL